MTKSRIFLALMCAASMLLFNVQIAEAVYKNRLTVNPTSNPIDWPYTIDLGQLVQSSLIQAFKDEANFHLVPASTGLGQLVRSSLNRVFRDGADFNLAPLSTKIIAPPVFEKKDSSAKEYRGLMHPAKFDVVSRLIHVELDKAPPPAQRILIPGGYRQSAKLILAVDIVAHHTGRSIAHKRIQASSQLGSLVVNLNQLPEDFDYDQLHKTSLGFALDSISQKILSFVNHHLYSHPLEGETIMVDSHKKEAIISLGRLHGVKMGELFDVYGVTLKFKHPFSQTDLGDKYDRRGVLRIKEVQEQFSVGKIVAGEEFWEGDLARSRKYNRLPLEEAASASAN